MPTATTTTLRRSSRTASNPPVKSTNKPPPPKARSKPRTKRAAPPQEEDSPPPPTKRARGASTPKLNGTNGTANGAVQPPPNKAPSRTARTKTPVLQHVRKTVVQTKPYFNPLPAPFDFSRPAPQIFGWGAGNFGQLGMGPDRLGEFEKPTRNTLIEKKMQEGVFGDEGAGFVALAAGGMHTLLLDEKGTVWSCGVDEDAALGRITTKVPNPEKEGEFYDIDTLLSVPFPVQSLVDQEFRVARIAAGDTISAAISATGDLRVWGSFREKGGFLGFSSNQERQYLPVPILELRSKPGDSEKFTEIAAGNNHLIVLTTHGNIYTWGVGEQGQLGRKLLERRKMNGTVPEKIVLGHRHTKAVVIGAGGYTSFAVDEAGIVWAWGLNNAGQTGTDETVETEIQTPRRVVGLSKEELGGDEHVVQIVGGEHHTLFRTSAGRVFACGRRDGGQLGLDDDDVAFEGPDVEKTEVMLTRPAVVTFPDMDDAIMHISAGIHSNVAITEGGAMYAWGTGPQSELGTGTEIEMTPKVVVRKEGGKWAALTATIGGQHAIGLFRKKE